MITAGFTLIGRGQWSGGETYQRNMFGVMADLLAGQVQAKLFLSPAQAEKVGSSFDRFLCAPPIIDACVEGAGEGRRALAALATGADSVFGRLVAGHGVNVMFESAQWFGNRFPVPVLSWIPDFQHRRLPHLFPRQVWWKRDIGFRVQTAGRRIIMLSSEDGRNDCEEFYPASRGRTRVVRFAIDLDPAAVHARADAARHAHGLPERVFYLPNQFWAHKNHATLIDALLLIAKRGQLDAMPPVILTGRTEDARDPGLYGRLLAKAEAGGVISHFRHIGLIPYEDVFALNAAAQALINPSLFEGWSTTVEEAKALGTPMLLSDIPLHREQAPDATFFKPLDAGSLADALVTLAAQPPRPAPDMDALRHQQSSRRHRYAEALLAALIAAQALRRAT